MTLVACINIISFGDLMVSIKTLYSIHLISLLLIYTFPSCSGGCCF